MEDNEKTSRIDENTQGVPATTTQPTTQPTQQSSDATSRADGKQGMRIIKANNGLDGNTSFTVQPDKPRMDKVAADSSWFMLNGYAYQCISRFAMESGEAQVYLVERDGQKYVLKIYYPNYHFQERILQSVCSIDVEMVMRVYEYGHTFVGGQERDYELMEYLRGGTLKEYQLEGNFNQFRAIALQAGAALACCHNAGIIHKDIKPANFFFRDEKHRQVVLGDFGISTPFDDRDELIRTTQARTPAFAAPEMYDDVIDGEVEINYKSDYYSLGITLLYLWLGRMPFGRNERDMIRMKQEGRIPQLSEVPPRVGMLIRGLTSINPKRRWGYNEIERWFKGEEVAVDQSSAYLRYKTFILDAERNLIAHDVKELVPLLYDNREIGISFLYNKRISTWLDECGNAKMAVMLTDIVEHRYPKQPQAGLLSAIYTLDPKFPFYDVKGTPCTSLHSISLSLMQHSADYLVLLKDRFHPYFLYLETHSDADINRIRDYFSSDHADITALLKSIYETDSEMPFLPSAPSSTIPEIVAAYGSSERTEAEWQAITDGRLLAWMYRHCEVALCESTRVLCEQQRMPTRTRAYTILYNIDRTAAFDLREANSEMQVAGLLAKQLQQCQHLGNESFTEALEDYLQPRGRLYQYAAMHQWTHTLQLLDQCLPVDSKENRDRMGFYDAKTAAYKLCVGMGGHPLYHFNEDGNDVEIRYPEEVTDIDRRVLREEVRVGSLRQWMSVFYHEDPNGRWDEPMSREHRLEDYLMLIGQCDPADIHYKRFTKAQDEMNEKVAQSRADWNHSQRRKRSWMIGFFGLATLWIVLLATFGIHFQENFSLFHSYIYYYVCIPVGLAMGAMGAFYSYFRGHGVLMGVLWAAIGAASSWIPASILDFCCFHFPNWLTTVGVLMSLVYVAVAWFTAFNTTDEQLQQLKAVFEIDHDKALQEQLYHTFKTHSFKFKGSNFALLNDAVKEAKATSDERVLNCIAWSILFFVLIMLFVWYHPSLLGHTPPDVWTWKLRIWDFEHQIKNTL